MPYQDLNELSKAAKELSEILERLPEKDVFDDTIKNNLAQLKIKLENESEENESISAEDYFKNPVLQNAMQIVKERNQHFLPAVLKAWWQQPHAFTNYEKIFVALSAITLLTGAILTYEILVLFFDGKPRLKITGHAMMDYCTTSLNQGIFETCLSLEENKTAVFSINTEAHPENLASYVGHIDDASRAPIPGTTFQRILSLFYPIAWIDFFRCRRDATSLTMIGDAYHGSLTDAEKKAINGFPVINSTIVINAFAQLGVESFLGLFCLLLQNGGISTTINLQTGKPYGHFDGFERFADDFEGYAYGFTDAYSGLLALALISMSVLQCKKAILKWQESREKRAEASDIYAACHLYQKYGNIQVITDEQATQRNEM